MEHQVIDIKVNRWLETMLEAHPPPLVQGRRLRIRYATRSKQDRRHLHYSSVVRDLPDHYCGIWPLA